VEKINKILKKQVAKLILKTKLLTQTSTLELAAHKTSSLVTWSYTRHGKRTSFIPAEKAPINCS
jgi:hypothetical protein